ncbi:MAG: restriction endonuclease [Myxococcota bacterium]
MAKKLTLREAAEVVLRDRGPLHYKELTAAVLEAGLAESSSATPDASLNAMLAVDIKRKGTESRFMRTKPGVFALRGLHDSAPGALHPPDTQSSDTEPERRVRVPLFPPYSEVRHLLRVWPGRPRRQITGLKATIGALRGTPQQTVDWTDPDAWIEERLSGEDRELAEAIWKGSDGAVNPRHSYGHWLLATKYELLAEDAAGIMQLTDVGRGFLDSPGGDVEVALDEGEGLIKLLSIVADTGPARSAALMEDWTEYLQRHSSFNSDSTMSGALRQRLNNLLERALVERRSSLYSVTQRGLDYLAQVGDEDSVGGQEQPELRVLIRDQEKAVRESLRDLLLDMDPFAFEHLIKRLLEEMDYQNVRVTSPGGDGGVDVIADIELGITSVREVVQVKRHRRTIQRKDLDALRGSLYRFDAVRGTIISTSSFSKGTKEAAFATGAAPITLIDGDKLVDFLIEHGIGVRKRTVELLEVDADDFIDGD